MAVKNEKFGKAYKLCHLRKIEQLFSDGKKTYKFPFSAQYVLHKEEAITPFQIVISVPKRNFKKAVDRNRLKRLIREAVRKNKLILESFLIQENLKLYFMLVFTNKEEMAFQEIYLKTENFIKHLIQEIKDENQA